MIRRLFMKPCLLSLLVPTGALTTTMAGRPLGTEGVTLERSLGVEHASRDLRHNSRIKDRYLGANASQSSCPDRNELRCDGMVDCPHGADETIELCSNADLDPYELGSFGLYQPPGVVYDQERYSYFFETFQPYLKSALGEVGPSTEEVEVYFLEAPHSNQFMADWWGWTHAGVGFKLLGKNRTELGRLQMQYWAMAKEVPTRFLPKMVLESDLKGMSSVLGREQIVKPLLDEDGRPTFGQMGALTIERSRGAWEGGYWKFPHLMGTITPRMFTDSLRWIESWAANHKMFVPFGIVDAFGETILPMSGCTNFVKDTIQHITSIDPLKLPGVVHLDLFFEMNVVKYGADLSEVQKAIADDPEILKAEDSPNHLLVVPAMYTREGNPWEDEDFVNTFHLLRPTPFASWLRAHGLWCYGVVHFSTAGKQIFVRNFVILGAIYVTGFTCIVFIVRWVLILLLRRDRKH